VAAIEPEATGEHEVIASIEVTFARECGDAN
jgi:hypothetical protein